MIFKKIPVQLVLSFVIISRLIGQTSEAPLKTFGYFQASFYHQYKTETQTTDNTFNLQQLNLFLQKDLAANWTAFVNLEILNNYSSNKKWGAFNLEEAWLRYRCGKEFNIKLGLQVPIFNDLNEIKNRTPILPYIIRPLVYETSFNEVIATEEFVPARAFVQSYGFFQFHKWKFDYAAYLGNSPNINNYSGWGQTGVDTSSTLLIGGRIGVRTGELKAGFSLTHDRLDFHDGNRYIQEFGGPISRYQEIPRIRLGADLSYNYKKLSLKSELIHVNYDDDIPEIDISKKFYYATLGYYFTDQLFFYGSYWFTEEHSIEFNHPQIIEPIIGVVRVKVPTLGVAYHFSDRITMKAQIAEPNITCKCNPPIGSQKFRIATTAVSVFF